MGVEFHQRHLEQHACCLQEGRARRQARDEDEIEQREKSHEHHREHHREREKISAGVSKSVGEETKPAMVLPETENVDESKETSNGKKHIL